jgi:rhomboid protease GluP
MANCSRCGREISHGTVCPDCQAAADYANPLTVSPRAAQTDGLASKISVTAILVGINVAVYVAMVATGVSPLQPTTQQLLKWGANFGPLSLGPQPWRILTSNYVHIGALHILFNMWCLWSLGHLAERIFRPLTYVFLYTCCGLAGSLASLWWHPMVVGAGASGAIFGIAGAMIAVFYLGKLPIPPATVRSTLKSLLVFAGYNLFFGLAAGVDNFAHLGGLLAGLAFGAVVSKHIIAPAEVRRRWELYASIGMALLLLLAGSRVKTQFSHVAAAAELRQESVIGMQKALIAFQRRDYDQAIAQLQPVIQQSPDAPEPRYILGLAYLAKNQFDDAINSFQEALRLKPDYAEAEEGLGTAYEGKGMQQEADEAYKKADAMAKPARKP